MSKINKGCLISTKNSAKNQNDNIELKNINDINKRIDKSFSETKIININNEKSNTKQQTIFHVAEDYLNNKYDFRFNTILLDIETKRKQDTKWKICNEDSLYIEMQKNGINIQISKLISILKSDYVKKYNPIAEYFVNLPKWDNKDHIDYLTTFISTPNRKKFSYHLKKWLVRSVKCMLIDGYFNKQAFIITDKGKGQDIGKSHLTKWLCPPGLPSSRSFEDSKKDNLVKLTKNAFIILDELDGISKRDLNNLKTMFSLDETRVRLPYAKREESIQRIANFIGSTNDDAFLNDPTGSVRWLVFMVNNIDWNYSKVIDVNAIWSQAYALSNDFNFDEKFNKEDIIENEQRNQEYQVRTPEAEMISIFFELPNKENNNQKVHLTSTEILQYLTNNSNINRLSPVSVGRAMTLLKFEKTKQKNRYGYFVVYTNTSLGTINK